jgi:hypothetical protein
MILFYNKLMNKDFQNKDLIKQTKSEKSQMR